MKTYFVKVSYLNRVIERRVHENYENVTLIKGMSVVDSLKSWVIHLNYAAEFTVDFIAPMSMFEDSE